METNEKYYSIAALGKFFEIDDMLPQSFRGKHGHLFVEPTIKIRSAGAKPYRLYPLNEVIKLATERGHAITHIEQAPAIVPYQINEYKTLVAELKQENEKLKQALRLTKPKFAHLKPMRDIMMSRALWRPLCGVYFLFKSDECVYIGQSVNIMSRIATHAEQKEFCSYAYLEFPRDKLNEMETLYILTYKPKLNLSSNGYYCVPCSDTRLRYDMASKTESVD